MSCRFPLLALWLLLVPVTATAQQLPPAATEPARAAQPAGPRNAAAPAAVVASMLLPGAGQWLQGQSRWVPYLAVEVWSWLRFRQRRADSRRLAERYRDLAWNVARRVSGITDGGRRDTVFEYYEAMTHYTASGLWDMSESQEGIQPEQDTATFNGQVWWLARGLFFHGGEDFPAGSPEYEEALAYYRQHGIPERYAWAWSGSSLEQQVFMDLITDSDDAYREGTRMLGLILANHVASTVDALITARLRALASDRTSFRSGLAPEGTGARLRTEVRISF
ncbi:MAG: hypothetical protein FIB01_08485 [Gemmatimonadetes bacterium]|nr:hypothetical protein [Gemmatimonadota bacterium]